MSKIDPRYHDCVYTDPDLRYKACGMCIYRFSCKWIRYKKEDLEFEPIQKTIEEWV